MKNEQVVQLPMNRLTEFPEHPYPRQLYTSADAGYYHSAA